jgi:hypothetical protein
LAKEKNPKKRAKIQPVRAFSTNRDLWFDIEKDAPVAPAGNDDDEVESDDDTFFLEAQHSPSKRPVKPTAQSERRLTDKVCAKCGVEWKSAIGKRIDSPGIGCDGYNPDNTMCSYWVHLCCLGLPDFSRSEFSDREFYCDNHNPKIADIRAMVERNEQNKKGKKKRPNQK